MSQLVSEGAHATYLFRVAPRATYAGESPRMLGDVMVRTVADLSDALIDLAAAALDEVYRVLKDDGRFVFTIPMEDGFLYNTGRNFTTRRYVEKKYNVDYMKIIHEYEHPNTAGEILKKINNKFIIKRRMFLPFLLPSVAINIMGVFQAVKR